MPAYVRDPIPNFVKMSVGELIGRLERSYAADGFSSQYTRQTKAWAQLIPDLQRSLGVLVELRPGASSWSVLLEYPLYRLRRRIDVVILAGTTIVVVECKVGAEKFNSEDLRQVEEYALDLRDFHAASNGRSIVPVLWSTGVARQESVPKESRTEAEVGSVVSIARVGREGLTALLADLVDAKTGRELMPQEWDNSDYKPVPNVIEAATSIFAGHNVRSIANADADNLRSASNRIVALIDQARIERRRYLVLLTGVPGSGKTLAGLDVVHNAIAAGVENEGEIVYLSGNTPLVVVLREALARDKQAKNLTRGLRTSIGDVRRQVRTRIQHINDFLLESLRGSTSSPPHEHVIVFDEAQRAWDEKQGFEKFERRASEPSLILELMSRHLDWCVCVCLLGTGQEINSGEDGIRGWGEALRKMMPDRRQEWSVFGPASTFEDGSSGSTDLGSLPPEVLTETDTALELSVPQKSFRSPELSVWVERVLAGDWAAARETAKRLGDYPIALTRSLPAARAWLKKMGKGERRYGLLASSGARRLRADGLGAMLHASSGEEIAQWYLNPHGDIRSSYALEIPANEYTCQGLELDFTCICWGGDFTWNWQSDSWSFARLSGNQWQTARVESARRFLLNSYRVLLTRAREGFILWIPKGDSNDHTRPPGQMDQTADFLERCSTDRWYLSSSDW
jgi:Uncharacterized conserved protein (DUF2075)